MDVEHARARQAGVTQWLREVYGPEPSDDMMSVAIQRLENTDEFLFDSVEQVRVDHWHDGRIVLLGDAAWCPTLYFGMGATSALAGADAPGLMLAKRPDDVGTALLIQESKLRPTITDFQQSAYPMRVIFTQTSAKEQRRQGINATMCRFMLKFPALMNPMLRSKHFRLCNSDLAAGLA